MAPFQFAMNEVYLRDGSRKVKDVLRMKRSKGEYCACPPFGYKKDPRNRDRLVPDEETAPIVARIFQRSAAGDSCIKIAQELTAAGVITPLKYRVLELHHGKTDHQESGLSWQYAAWENPQGKHQVPQKDFRSPGGLGHNVQHARTSR